jgi:homoserine kinase
MRASVSVPATSANLGPGFDTFGLALDIRNVVTIDTAAAPGVTWALEGAAELPTDGSDLISRTMEAVAARMQEPLPGFALHGENHIPLARGLGSSSAAIVAGVVLASVVLELGLHHEPDSVFALAAEFEGHPDNAAPACFGGFTIAVPGGFVRRLDAHPGLTPATLIVPTTRLLTEEARAALPETVPFADAVFNVGHAALLVEALTHDPTLLGVAMHDRLHEQVRLALVPEVRELFDELQRREIPVCVSGAGPTLLAFPGPSDEIELLGAAISQAAVSATGYEVLDG